MGFVHSLEVLYALVSVYAKGDSSAPTPSLLSLRHELPFPHLQQRLQQTLRAVALTAAGAVVAPVLLLLLTPVLSPFAYPGLLTLSIVYWLLWLATVAQLTLRYVMLPTPRRCLRSRHDPMVAVRGGLQSAVCAVVDTLARVRLQPQLPLLFALCVAHAWIWKLVLYYGLLPLDAGVGANFSAFAVAGGVVAFTSFVAVEKSLGDDPFALDPRAALQSALQRDVVRALRRGVLVYALGRVLCWLFCSRESADDGMTGPSEGFFAVHAGRLVFQITSSTLENLAILSSASVFRLLLFRASYAAVDGAFEATGENLWDTLVGAKPKEGDVMGALLTMDVGANPQSSTLLNEQYVQKLRQRVDTAVQQINERKAPKAPADAEDVEILDSLFAFENLLLGCKFDAAARESLLASRQRWEALLGATTGAVDGFTLLLQLLNTLAERKSASSANGTSEALELEQSVSKLLSFLMKHQDAHPLLLLDQHPYLANLRVSATSFKSRIQFFFISKLQFAVRRFLVEEARRRVFQRAKVVRSAQALLCHLVGVSRAEDKQGNVQHTVPAVLSSLVECRKALDAYMETCLKDTSESDIYVQEATSLAKGIDNGIYRITEAFYGELSLFTFPPGVKSALQSYVNFDA